VTFSVSDGLAVDSVETVIAVLAPNSWQNRSNPADVDGNGRVSPLDVLVLINHVNRFGSGPLPAYQPGDPHCDVNGDGQAGPLDSLLVINYLNAVPEAEGESESSETVEPFWVAPLGRSLPEGSVEDRVRTGERMRPSSPQSRLVWAVNANPSLQSVDQPGEDLLTVLAARSRLAWRAAADDLFSDLGSLEHSCSRPA
jgi:hypothetical protein